MAQSIPGVPIPHPPPPPSGICGAFVILVLEKLQMPLGGAQNIVQIPHPGQHQLKIVFSSK